MRQDPEERAANRLKWAEREREWELSRYADDGNKASQYEHRNRDAYVRSNGKVGMPIPLYPRGVFWSRGFRGCPQCNGDVSEHRPNKMYLVVEGDYVRIGWSCTGQPGKWEA